MGSKVDVCLEVGKSRAFASAIDWPGWSRSGRDPDTALRTLFEYAPRYAGVVGESGLGFEQPTEPAGLRVVERLSGGSGTDFGAPEMAPAIDSQPMSESDFRRQVAILRACWRAFDANVTAARDKPLRIGARGGGRDLDAIVSHVLEGDGGYLWRLASRKRGDQSGLDRSAQLERTRQALLEGLEAAVQGQVPSAGPRGGKRWSPRYFVRRVAWHVLDHAWEIEDRIPDSSDS